MSEKLKRWSNEEIEYIKNNYGLISPKEIGDYLGRTRGSVIAKAHDLSLGDLGKWSKEEEQFLINNHNIMSKKEIAKALGRTETAIDIRMSRLGLCGMKYNYNRDFFEIIDTEEKAYWLGFLYADGCVNINDSKNKSGEVCIKLKASDLNHLKKFNKSLNGNIPVEFGEFICNLNNKLSKTCVIRCYSYKMVSDLINHGCVERKSLIVKMPTHLETDLYRHFIRGYYDGNGGICLSNRKRKDLKINFCTGSKDMAEGLRSVLYSFGINSYIITERENTTYRLYVAGMKNVDNMIHFMYDNSTISLDRKLEKQKQLYEEYKISSRLLRLSEMVG